MISRAMAQQFEGALAYDWQPNGLVVTLRMRKDQLAADSPAWAVRRPLMRG